MGFVIRKIEANGSVRCAITVETQDLYCWGDPQFGQVLVLGSGGVTTELWHDSASLLPPFTPARIGAALGRLVASRLLAGFRGKPPGDVVALIEAIGSVARYARAHLESLTELDVNPIIVRPQGRGVVAVDALIRLVEDR